MNKAELIRLIREKSVEITTFQDAAFKDPKFAEIKRRIRLCQTLEKKYRDQSAAYFEEKYAPQNKALTGELAALQKQLADLHKKPDPPQSVKDGLARLIQGVQTKLVAKEWSQCGRWVYATKPGASHYISRASPSVYSPTDHYLFDLDALKTHAHLLRGLNYQRHPFAIAHHEGRLSKSSLENWRQQIHATGKPKFILHANPVK